MKMLSVLLALFFIGCSHDDTGGFIPKDFEYPDNKIGSGKTFVYVNKVTKQQFFNALKTLDIDGKHFQILKSYDSTSISDSIKRLNGKTVEAYNFFMNKGGSPIKAENIQDTVIKTNQKLGMHIITREYHVSQLIYKMTLEEQFLKDTTIRWEGGSLPCLVTLGNTTIATIAVADSSVNHLTKVVSKLYYGKGMGLLKYSIQFTDRNGKDNYGLWELGKVEDTDK